MAEPQPATLHPSADLDDDAPAPLPKSAEDRKAAAALSSMTAPNDDDDSAQPAKEVDQEALGKAMRSLDIAGGRAKGGKDAGTGGGAADGEKKKRAVRIEAGDVAILVSFFLVWGLLRVGFGAGRGAEGSGGERRRAVEGRYEDYADVEMCRWMSWSCRGQRPRIF